MSCLLFRKIITWTTLPVAQQGPAFVLETDIE